MYWSFFFSCKVPAHVYILSTSVRLLLLFGCQVVSDSDPRGLNEACQVCLSLTISQSLPKFMSIESVMSSNHLILCSPLLLPSNLPQHQDLFQWVSSLHQWPKNWNFSFSIHPFNEYSRLISFKIGWFDLRAVQGTLKSLLQHHSSKASLLWRSAAFMVQLSHLFVTTGKSIAFPVWTFVGKVMSLFFNILYRFVIAFLPRSNRLLISQLQSLSAVILEPKKRKLVTTSTFSPSIC